MTSRRRRSRAASWLVLVTSACALAGCASSTPAASPGEHSLAEAWRVLSEKRFVDLTHTFSPTTPLWSGFGPATFSPEVNPATGQPYTIAKDGFHATRYAMVGECGTHVDAPAHFDPQGKTLDELPLKEMILPLVVFDITPKLRDNPNYALTVDDILAWEQTHGRVPAGSFAALRTNMSRDWTRDPKRFEREPFPAWSLEAIQFLYEQRGIVASGHEAMDTDTTPEMKSETWLLRHGHWQIEVMANLDQVPPTGALLVVAWPKPKDGLGFPVRAFAILP
jgi:kynurenine formamidase